MSIPATGAGRAAAASDDAAANILSAVLEWIKRHRQATAYGGAAILVAAVLFAWNLLSARTAEQNAGRQIEQGRLALASRNYPLAASVLSQTVENYSGTHAAQEGNILLAQVRLAQGQSDQAIAVLKRFAPGAGRDFRAQAYGLLGAAYENAGRPRDAGQAYEQAADAAPYPFLRAQYLSDAGRAWVDAKDTVRALAAYRTVAEKFDSTVSVTEAKVRIGELTKGAGSVGSLK